MNSNNINLEKIIKEEYTIVYADYYPSATGYYVYNESDDKMPRNLLWWLNYNWGTKYSSKEVAETKLKELLLKGFFRKCTNVVDGDKLRESIIDAHFKYNYDKTKAIAVVKIPISHYLGEYGAYAFEINKLNLSYDNEHRYQCITYHDFKKVFLKINEDKSIEWVDSYLNATYMTKNEQEKWCDKLNNDKSIKDYVQEYNLPVRLDTIQKYYKGQKVLIRQDGQYYYTYISDVMARMDGKYYYGVPSHAIYCGRISIHSEGQYEGADLYPEDKIILFEEVVKSRVRKETDNGHYYDNVIFNDGTKIGRIEHF